MAARRSRPASSPRDGLEPGAFDPVDRSSVCAPLDLDPGVVAVDGVYVFDRSRAQIALFGLARPGRSLARFPLGGGAEGFEGDVRTVGGDKPGLSPDFQIPEAATRLFLAPREDQREHTD